MAYLHVQKEVQVKNNDLISLKAYLVWIREDKGK